MICMFVLFNYNKYIVPMFNTCQAQRDFIRQSIIHNIRIDGRQNQAKRTLSIKNGVISHLPGSSYVFQQYENTEIYTGVKAKIQDNAQKQENIQIALEISSMRKIEDQENNEMLRIQHILNKHLVRKLQKCQQIKQFLKIEGSKKHKLQLFLDVFILSPPHVSQIQIIAQGIKSALLSTQIAQVEVSYNQVTEEETADIVKKIRKLPKMPWDQIRIIGLIQQQNSQHFVLDMKRQQFDSMDSCFLVIMGNEKVEYIESLKGQSSIDTINKCARFALRTMGNKRQN